MAKGFVVNLMIFLLVAALTSADEQNDPHSSRKFTEDGEDEVREVLYQVLERLLQENRPPCQQLGQCNQNADRSAKEQELRNSEVNVKAYNENEEGSQESRFDDFGSPPLQPNLIEPGSGQIRSLRSNLNDKGSGQTMIDLFDDFRSPPSYRELTDNGSGEIKRDLFDDFRSPPSYRELTDNDSGQIKGDLFDDYRSLRSYLNLNDNDKGQIKRNHFDNFRSPPSYRELTDNVSGQIKRNHFDNFRSPPSYRELTGNGSGQIKRDHFDNFRSPPSYRELTDNVRGQIKRDLFDDYRSLRSHRNLNAKGDGQIKRNHFDDFRSPLLKRNLTDDWSGQYRRSNNYFKSQRKGDKYGDTDTPQTDGRQTNRLYSPIQSSFSDNFESDQEQSRRYDSGHAETKISDYENSEEQQTQTKYIDGQESPQIGDNGPQKLRSELQISQPTRACTTKQLVGCRNLQERDSYDADYENPQEQIRHPKSKAHNRMEPKTAEAEEIMSSDELLALLVKLARDKRREEPPKT